MMKVTNQEFENQIVAAIKKAIEEQIERYMAEEIENAKARLEAAVRKSLASIILSVQSQYTVHYHGTQIVITVDRKDLR